MKINVKVIFLSYALALVSTSGGSAQQLGQDELSSFLNSGNDQTSVEKLLKAPNDRQVEYLESLSANIGSYAMTTGSDGTVAGLEVIEALRGEVDKTIGDFSIQVDPDLSENDLRDALARNGLLVTDTASDFGILSAKKILAEEFVDTNTKAFNEAYQRSLDTLRADPSFTSVAPEPSLGSMDIFKAELSIGPMPYGEDLTLSMKHLTLSKEVADWGLKNIGAEVAWKDDRAQLGKAIGVLDVGFAIHKDLPYWDPPTTMPVADHGNHVSGIICAKHNNNIGTRGVLPYCLLVVRVPKFGAGLGPLDSKPSTISAMLKTFEEIVSNRDDLKAVNISMGYNWRKRFGVTLLSEKQKEDVRAAARQLAGAYKIAKDRDIFIVSAAGNDSWGLPNPKLNAAWASPMNLASVGFCSGAGLCNGLVVEAHNIEDKPADFSNIGGDLSCPGVNILSAVAHNNLGEPSTSDYATTSGTSMAAPYCLGGLVLLSMVRPEYSAPEIITCAKKSGRKIGPFNAKALDIPAALVHCPPK